jgi:hypothetical protein
MDKTELRELLNKPQANFTVVVRELVAYVLASPVKEEIANYIITKAKSIKSFTIMDLVIAFIEKTSDLVVNTRFCTSVYATQMLLKSVWEQARFSTLVIEQIKKNYALFTIQPKVELVTTKDEKLARQAKLMREAKAKKAEEKHKQEQIKVQPLAEPVKAQVAVKPVNAVVTPEANKIAVTKNLSYIEMLKDLHI